MLYIFRAIFIILSGLIGWQIERLFTDGTAGFYGMIGGVGIALLFVLVELGFTKRFIGSISIVMFGLVFGFVISYIFISVLTMLPWVKDLDKDIRNWLEFGLTFLFCFIAIIAIIRTKDDFKFVIPFIELSRERKGAKPLVIDTSVIIDGRIAELCATGLIDAPLIIPRFVLLELQSLADSADRLKRTRGRHGLDILNQIKKYQHLTIQINEAEFPYIKDTDQKLMKLTQSLNGRLFTTDFNLNKVAQLEGIEVVNLNDIANALKTVVLPGELLEIKILKPGEERDQGIGYLNDGTMVVVEGGRSSIGQKATVTVTSTLQTSAGKMIFATRS